MFSWLKRKQAETEIKQTILVIDDEHACRETYGEILERAGYKVDKAASSAEAWELIQKNTYAAILSDNNLGPGDGFLLLRETFKQHDIKIPVVLMSGDIKPWFAELRQQGGIADFVQKPVRREVILKVIADAIAIGQKKTQASASAIHPDNIQSDRPAGMGGIS